MFYGVCHTHTIRTNIYTLNNQISVVSSRGKRQHQDNYIILYNIVLTNDFPHCSHTMQRVPQTQYLLLSDLLSEQKRRNRRLLSRKAYVRSAANWHILFVSADRVWLWKRETSSSPPRTPLKSTQEECRIVLRWIIGSCISMPGDRLSLRRQSWASSPVITFRFGVSVWRCAKYILATERALNSECWCLFRWKNW